MCWIYLKYKDLLVFSIISWHLGGGGSKTLMRLLNLRTLKFSHVNKIYIFQCMSKIFCVEFQRYPLKFHTKYLTHTLKDIIFIQHCEILRALRFKGSYMMFLKCSPGNWWVKHYQQRCISNRTQTHNLMVGHPMFYNLNKGAPIISPRNYHHLIIEA